MPARTTGGGRGPLHAGIHHPRGANNPCPCDPPLPPYSPSPTLSKLASEGGLGVGGGAKVYDGVEAADVVKQLGSQALWIRDLADPACLRACTHVFTTGQDINALADAIEAISTR